MNSNTSELQDFSLVVDCEEGERSQKAATNEHLAPNQFLPLGLVSGGTVAYYHDF